MPGRLARGTRIWCDFNQGPCSACANRIARAAQGRFTPRNVSAHDLVRRLGCARLEGEEAEGGGERGAAVRRSRYHGLSSVSDHAA